MSEPTKPFSFGNFVPGFDFLKNLSGGGATASALPGMSGLSNWIAPTLSVEEVDKRIQELKAVQFWLDQNVNALKATVQALEVQKMTLSTLKGMNVRMEDLANAFTRSAGAASAGFAPSPSAAPAPAAAPRPSLFSSSPAPASTPAPQEPPRGDAPSAREAADDSAAAPAAGLPGVIDPLQWWSALTQQFEQIASSALRDASNLKMPAAVQSMVEQATDALGAQSSAAIGKTRSAARKTAAARAAGSSGHAAPAPRRAAPAKRAASSKR